MQRTDLQSVCDSDMARTRDILTQFATGRDLTKIDQAMENNVPAPQQPYVVPTVEPVEEQGCDIKKSQLVMGLTSQSPSLESELITGTNFYVIYLPQENELVLPRGLH